MTSRNIIAIGGGGFGRNPGEGVIEEYILKQTRKKKPNICFIPTATGDNDAYKVNYYETFSKLACNPTHLDFFKRTPDLKKLISNQDACLPKQAISNRDPLLFAKEPFPVETRPVETHVLRKRI